MEKMKKLQQKKIKSTGRRRGRVQRLEKIATEPAAIAADSTGMPQRSRGANAIASVHPVASALGSATISVGAAVLALISYKAQPQACYLRSRLLPR